ncbi:hypothetical protein [Microcoleus sp. FACHB-1515]|nr:hypothetical protein [Microcoleus sp. FACHB-1515]
MQYPFNQDTLSDRFDLSPQPCEAVSTRHSLATVAPADKTIA